MRSIWSVEKTSEMLLKLRESSRVKHANRVRNEAKESVRCSY